PEPLTKRGTRCTAARSARRSWWWAAGRRAPSRPPASPRRAARSSCSSARGFPATTSASRCCRRRCPSSTASASRRGSSSTGFSASPAALSSGAGRPSRGASGSAKIRAEFDQILLENARAHGADVREEHAVTAIDTSGPSPAIEATRADGRPVRFAPRFVIDASGQQALLGRARGLRRFNEFFKNLAIFGYFRNAERLPGALANHILSAAFGDGWFWYIPLHDGTMSVGAVVDVRHWE